MGFLFYFGHLFGQNIAYHKPYQLSVKPNYSKSAPSDDIISLTDGEYTNEANRFWSEKTTVGWAGKSQVRITIDLEKIEPVKTVSFNTAAGTAEVYFPNNLYVFISDDGKNYKYVGEASNIKGTQYGTYKISKFILKDINHNARYVALEVIPKGRYLFCDEIEILKGADKSSSSIKESFPLNALPRVIDSLKIEEHNLASLQRIVDKLSRKHLQLGFKEYSILEKNNNSEKIKKNIIQKYGVYLSKRFNTSFIMEKQNPWEAISQIHEPKNDLSKLNYNYSIPVKGVQYGAFSLTNSSNSTQTISFKVSNFNSSRQDTEIYSVPFIPFEEGKEVADPIIPLKDEVKIEAGFTKLFFFKLKGLKKGTANTEINIYGENKTKKIGIHSNVLDIFSLKDKYVLNANIWGYLNYKMIKDRKIEAARDIEDHHVNTTVLSASVLPRFKASSKKYKKITTYLKNYNDIKNVLIFYNFESSYRREGYKEGQFMSSTWKKYFTEWYTNVIIAIKNSGFSNPQIYFYPYDEITEKDVKEFKGFIKWAKGAIPTIKFYATLSHQETFAEILPLLDIAQLYIQNKPFYDKLPPHHAEIWTYGNKSSARSVSPYKFYRMKAWQAFANDVKGIGFWTYAERHTQFINSPLINSTTSFSVIYNGPDNSIISTRRWEAFKLGIEDYQILYLYEKKYGKREAMNMVNQVLANSNDLTMADKVRNKMISKLW